MWKNNHVVMLPTQSKAVRLGQLVIGAGNNLFSSRKSNDIGSLTAYELYITSNEEMKEGYYGLSALNEVVLIGKLYDKSLYKKIIATTDTSLEYIKHETYPNGNTTGIRNLIELPQLSKEFIKIYIEEYNKGNVITKVMVEYEVMDISTMTSDVKTYPNLNIETLKLNPDNTINIKLIKDSWSREEHITNIKAFAKEFVANTNTAYKQADIDKWIENNL